MNRRGIFSALLLLPFVSSITNAQDKKQIPSDDSIMWRVPKGIKKVRVRSWAQDGDELMDTYINVKPGQVFKIDVVPVKE